MAKSHDKNCARICGTFWRKYSKKVSANQLKCIKEFFIEIYDPQQHLLDPEYLFPVNRENILFRIADGVTNAHTHSQSQIVRTKISFTCHACGNVLVEL